MLEKEMQEKMKQLQALKDCYSNFFKLRGENPDEVDNEEIQNVFMAVVDQVGILLPEYVLKH